MTENTDPSSNPYSTPEADLQKKDAGSGIQVFERFSAWAVFGLSIVTLSIYIYYWLYKRTQTINQSLEDEIPSALVSATIGLLIFSFIGGFAGGIAGAASGPDSDVSVFIGLAINLISLIGTILYYVWIFKVRNRINLISGKNKGESGWCGVLGTFFFHVLYMQYKINKNIDLESAS